MHELLIRALGARYMHIALDHPLTSKFSTCAVQCRERDHRGTVRCYMRDATYSEYRVGAIVVNAVALFHLKFEEICSLKVEQYMLHTWVELV